MDKQQQASVQPTFNEPPPPYPGNEPDSQKFAGGYSQPPPAQYGAIPPQGLVSNYPIQPSPMLGYVQAPTPTQPIVGIRGGNMQPVVVVQAQRPMRFDKYPMTMTCPHCQCQIQTSIRSEPGLLAWIFGGFLCLIGFWPCACIPCCIDDFNQVEHRCPNCNAYLGRFNGGM